MASERVEQANFARPDKAIFGRGATRREGGLLLAAGFFTFKFSFLGNAEVSDFAGFRSLARKLKYKPLRRFKGTTLNITLASSSDVPTGIVDSAKPLFERGGPAQSWRNPDEEPYSTSDR